MPRVLHRQEAGPESQESLVGDAVPVNGVEEQAARRAHMREQTTARQAAEQQRSLPSFAKGLDRPARLHAARVREVDMQVELMRINVGHQTWLREHGRVDPMENGPRGPRLANLMASQSTMNRFLIILKMLRGGLLSRRWAVIVNEVPTYAHVVGRGQRLDLRPKQPVAFEGKVYDLEHPIFVRGDANGIVRMVNEPGG